MLFKTLLILMLSGTSSLYLLNFHGTRVDRKGLLSTFMCLEIFVKLFLDLVRCSTFTSLPRIDVCGWQNFWKLDTLLVTREVITKQDPKHVKLPRSSNFHSYSQINDLNFFHYNKNILLMLKI